MSVERASILNEIRYAERLCQRSARLYRNMLWVSSFFATLGGSATLLALSKSAPEWVSLSGAAMFAVFGALVVATRPADKAAANEADAKRYAQIRAKAAKLDDVQLQTALDEARVTDAPEIEGMRDVAYNDVVREIGQPDRAVQLRAGQKLLETFA